MREQCTELKPRSIVGEKIKSLKSIIFLFLVTSFTMGLVVNLNNAIATEVSGISYDVVESAEITKVAFYIGEFKGHETIHFELGVKNVSEDPKRFKVMVSVNDGPSATYYYPRKGDPAVIEPGKVLAETMPVVFFDQLPKGFYVKIEEM